MHTLDTEVHGIQKLEAELLSTFQKNPSFMDVYYIDEDLFFFDDHKELWRVMAETYEKYNDINVEIVIQELMHNVTLMDYFFKYVLGYMDCKTSLDDTLKYLDEKYHVRALKQIASRPYENYEQFMAEIENIKSYFSSDKKGELMEADEIFKLITTASTTLRFKRADFMNNFDITPNTLNVIGARTGKGKTALSLFIALDLALNGYDVLYFNLENPKEVIYQRLVSMLTNFTKLQLRNLKYDRDRETVDNAIQKIINSNLKIYDSKDCRNLEEMRKIIKLECKTKMCVVFIDNINNLKSIKEFGSIRESINHATKSLLSIKASTNCIIFGLAQLRRADNRNPNAKPSEADLKESGSLEEDSDNVFLLHEQEQIENTNDFIYSLYTPKSRNEANYETLIVFDKAHQKFRSIEERERMEMYERKKMKDEKF